jgi:putative transcriptional regulator
MMREQPSAGNMTGTLLVAHPSLRDPNFCRTILFLSHHSAEDGAIGFVLNRPLDQQFGDLAEAPGHPFLESVPVFYGGPVSDNDLVLVCVQWHDAPAAVAFRGFGSSGSEIEIPPEFQRGLRAFRGYSGWSRGQLESEIASKAWIVVPPTKPLIEMHAPRTAWRDVMHSFGPIYKLLAEAPDDPSLN